MPARAAPPPAGQAGQPHPQIQGASEDITAAATALWTTALRQGPGALDRLTLDEPTVITVLLAQKKRWDDEGELVSVEFEEYWDATDKLRFSSGLLEEMKKELARGFLENKKADHVVVNNFHGIWLFDKAILEGVFA